MSKVGQKIINAIQDAINGEIASVTIDGRTFVRRDALEGGVVIPRSELEDAVNSWADTVSYKSEFLVQKHGDLEEIAEFRAKYLPEAKP